MTINELWERVKILSPQERDELLQRLIAFHNDALSEKQLHDILEFEGIASHLVDDEDPQTYINRIRDEWDDTP